MTFLYGITKRGILGDKLLDLISGAVPDDQGVTVALADRWRVRLNGLPGDQSFAPPASQDQTITQEHRLGYWGRFDDCCIYTDGSASGMDYVQQLTCWTAWHASFQNWALASLKITQANTTANNYSTARVTFYVVGIDVNGNPTGIASGTVLTPAVDGTCTYTYVSGYTITFKIGNSSTGKVSINSYYSRIFSQRYPGGVDPWRRAARNVDGLYTFTSGDVPVGTEGTDWEVNIGPQQYACPNGTGSSWYYQYVASFVSATGSGVQDGGSGGLGIKTNAALTGGHYSVTFTKQEAIAHLNQNGSYVYLYPGGVGKSVDGTALVFGVEGNNYQSTSYAFLQHNADNDLSNVQYWISVTATHISIVLNGEGASTWTTSSNTYTKVVADDPSYGVCWMFGRLGNLFYWQRNGSHSLIEAAMSKGKGYFDGGRDWQTGQGRRDMLPGQYYTYWGKGNYGSCMFNLTDSDTCQTLNPGAASTNSPTPGIPFSTDRTIKPPLTFPWQLSGFALMDYTSGYTETVAGTIGLYRFRGYVAEGLYQLPSGGFAQGDELTDTTSGDKYLLWQSGTTTFPGSSPYATGFALEEK